MKRLFVIILLVILHHNSMSTKNSVNDTAEYKTHFGFSLVTNANSELISYAIVTSYKGKVIATKIIPQQTFMFQITGRYPSPANRGRKNLLTENKIANCDIVLDHYQRKYAGIDCVPIKNLWKIKYKSHPYDRQADEGWSKKYYRPTDGQVLFLQQYGIVNMHDYFYGENMWKLLQDIQDPTWIEKYKGA